MPTTIKLDTNFAFGGSGSGGFSLPSGVATLGDLLRHIGREVDFPFIDPDSGDLEIDLEISINGKDIWFYPTGLNTPLKEGDVVDISMIPLGGG